MGTPEGARELALGAGGDRTLELDHAAEQAAFRVLSRLSSQARFSLLSEEAGRVSHGADRPLLLLDPIDGSLNAKRRIELFGFMAALVQGTRIQDTVAGYVLNLVSGEQWWAIKGGGAYVDGRRIEAGLEQGSPIEVLGLESGAGSILRAKPLLAMATKVRVPGSMALAINYAADGRLDLFCAPFPARVFDMAASLLLAAEAGAIATDLAGRSPGRLAADLKMRTDLLVAADPARHRQALAAMSKG